MIFKLVVSTSLLALLGCNKTSFTQPSKHLPADAPDIRVESFPLATTESKVIDMVWVIDNSGSMVDEIEQVRRNFSTFVSSVSKFANLQLKLISSGTTSGGLRGIDLPAQQQLNYEVASTNALSLLASGICPQGSTSSTNASRFTSISICNTALEGTIEGKDSILEIGGQLNSFFRANSKKVFVVVTDDDARLVDSTNFLQLVKTEIPQNDLYMFGFVGKTSNDAPPPIAPPPGSSGTAEDCNVARVGATYIDLANKTNGQTFDICRTDWTEHFQTLTQNVQEIAIADFTLNTDLAFELQAVMVDGVALPASAYQLEGNRLSIVDQSLLLGKQSLEVSYLIRKQP